MFLTWWWTNFYFFRCWSTTKCFDLYPYWTIRGDSHVVYFFNAVNALKILHVLLAAFDMHLLQNFTIYNAPLGWASPVRRRYGRNHTFQVGAKGHTSLPVKSLFRQQPLAPAWGAWFQQHLNRVAVAPSKLTLRADIQIADLLQIFLWLSQ